MNQNAFYSGSDMAGGGPMEEMAQTPPQTTNMFQRNGSLFDGDRDHNTSPSDSDSMSDWLGLNSPRGPLLTDPPSSRTPQSPVGFGRRKIHSSTPYNSPYNHYKSEDDIASPLRSFHRTHFDTGFHSMPNSPMVTRRQYTNLNKYNECGSPVAESYLSHSISSRSLSSTKDSIPTSSGINESGINDLMGSLNLQSCSSSDLDISGILPLLPVPLQHSAIRYLQQQQNLQASLVSLLQQQAMHSTPSTINNLIAVAANNTSPVGDGSNALDQAAKYHRSGASSVEATCTWSGILPARCERNVVYSCKVFLGGVPWDLSESVLEQVFSVYGPIRIEWPGKEQQGSHPKGYAYIIYENEKQVRGLLAACCKDYSNGGSYFYKISSRRIKSKDVQVIPWIISDSTYAKATCQKLDPEKTVFVGALHGMINAEGLTKIMDDLFGNVLYAGIDTDKFKYPIGSGRVTFGHLKSYMKAVNAGFIEVKTAKFTKKIQVDPYLEDAPCSSCSVQQGPYFCRDIVCFRYFCRNCWHWQHSIDTMKNHAYMSRSPKSTQSSGFVSPPSPNSSL